ncbi:dUTP diphosphatase [Bacillus sp. FJAT-29814]|uniref:dUTP diphosphatase n=1 Tax=Bacillus sp. FJAT-29814 TaxID=1729688 RepID=UPI0008304D14|nr:dUTP diphosphatase [Bacillus sp. FJAT-29814]
MNLTKLFETQKALRNRIKYDKPDRFHKSILGLLVELGECANEQRTWKFWSTDQQPRTRRARAPYMDLDDADFYNPLLEEYADSLHMLLDLGLQRGYDQIEVVIPRKTDNIVRQFILLYDAVCQFYFTPGIRYYGRILELFFGLGEMLEFTWEEIEEAYIAKNKINHHRQKVGY